MRYWLMKTEPDTFSIDDLARVGQEPWSGVRGYEARNNMRDMRPGDLALFYHSSCKEPGIYGLARVATLPYPDPTQFDRKSEYYDPKSRQEDPTWSLVDVAFIEKWAKPVLLSQLRANPKLSTMITLQPGSRLSVTPVTEGEFKEIFKHSRLGTIY